MELTRKTPLHGRHVALGARMVDFSGWSMPLHYASGSLEEHRLVRRSAGLFDTSHMGRLELGESATDFLERVVSSSLSDLPVGGARYGLLCRPSGAVIDDLFLYRMEDRWLVVVNAANKEKDLAWLRGQAAVFGACGGSPAIRDVSDESAMIALQGPAAPALLAMGSGRTDSPRVPPRMNAARIELFGIPALAGRTGYTGEDGFELFVPAGSAAALWDGLLRAAREAGIEAGPVGLAARDSLRFEPGFCLYGHEIDESTTAVEAGLLWACALGKNFIGRDALVESKRNGPRRRLVTLVMRENAVPRQGCRVLAADGSPVGQVVSGMYAPTVDRFAANAYVPPACAAPGGELAVEIRGTPRSAIVVKRPLYMPSYRTGGEK